MIGNILEAILKSNDGEKVIRAQFEIILWVLFGMIISSNLAFTLIQNGVITKKDILDNSTAFTISVTTMLFPVVFSFIYGNLPLQQIRYRLILKKHESIDAESVDTNRSTIEKAIDYFESLVISSTTLANKIFSRASLYLLCGVIISFIGLIFFYLQSSNYISSNSFQISLLNLAPKFGVLIFIEFIAVFFLKQYRSLMDEFRYYESLKRSREESLAILRMASSNHETFDFDKFLEKNTLKSNVTNFAPGHTTDLIESKKMEKSELDAILKIINAIRK
ncbi:hypothetical protein ABI244_00615 [Serratia ureilytica]|uniref:hypothetical protein n=1 Tax=Serratia ureilytica TaxID=300181 RepID=UPI002365AB7E|nr:hypothetical protein [Serratia ureilytica]WDF87993.1 hypothetical protein PTZ17_09995 [Serratia ureilytica]